MRRLNPLPETLRNTLAGTKKDTGKRGRRRREQRRQLLRTLAMRTALPLILASGIAGTLVWAWQSGLVARQSETITQAVEQRSAALGLKVTDVLVEGRERTEPSAILDALSVGYGGPILAVQPDSARRRLEALPWVKQAAVERQLPNSIYVRLVERAPLALWQLQGRLSVIDHDGKRINGVDPNAYAHLPLVVGPGAPEEAGRLLQALQAAPELAERMRAAVRVSGRRWNVRLDNDVDVQLPEENLTKAWAELARIERSHGVLQRDVRMIDLRLPDRMVVRMGPDSEPMEPAPQVKPEPGQST